MLWIIQNNLFGEDGYRPNEISFNYLFNDDFSNCKGFGVNGYSWGWNNNNKTEINISLSEFSGCQVSFDTVINSIA